MRIFAIVCALIVFTGVSAAQTFYGTTDVKVFRDGRDKEFRDRSQTPLLDDDLANFKGLNYFDVSEKFVVEADLIRAPGTEQFMMTTSAGITRKYLKYGTLEFVIEGQKLTLTIFESTIKPKLPEYADLLFVPFRDLTNGKETYGAGRYLDLRKPSGEKITVNFNLAYNPNCAYGSDKFSCPLPPRENFLQIKVLAGERNFEHAAAK